MKRILLTAALALTAALLTGCADSSILAEAGGGTHGLSGTVPSAGRYTLYHVTKFDAWGAPEITKEVTTVNLNANEKVGFKYETPADQIYNPDAQSHVIAFAGSALKDDDLGPLQSIEDHYYWCSPSNWAGFWAARPERVIGTKALQY